ncbi:hypothetical protein [Nocardia sp. NPDC057440]|uniref:hypothetical protein n=1 Tax=Nocardia sp. NPDC057440 TaxID=3346134 RepID=UPI00366D1C23
MKVEIKLAGYVDGSRSDDIEVSFSGADVQLEFHVLNSNDYFEHHTIRIAKQDWHAIASLV